MSTQSTWNSISVIFTQHDLSLTIPIGQGFTSHRRAAIPRTISALIGTAGQPHFTSGTHESIRLLIFLFTSPAGLMSKWTPPAVMRILLCNRAEAAVEEAGYSPNKGKVMKTSLAFLTLLTVLLARGCCSAPAHIDPNAPAEPLGWMPTEENGVRILGKFLLHRGETTSNGKI